MPPTTPTTTSPASLSTHLRRLGACADARTWAKGKSHPEAWRTCQDPDWLLWLIAITAPLTTQQNELLICRFVREVVDLTTDPRVLSCLEVRERWAKGNASDSERAAARGAATDAARRAVRGAEYAARGAATGKASGAAKYAVWAVAGGAAWATAWYAACAKQCDIIRELIPMSTL